MNLSQMLNMANSILDYAPGITAYETEVKRFLNEAYLDLFSDRTWSFAQKSVLIPLKKDRLSAIGSIPGAGNQINAVGFFTDDMAGMIVEISGSAAADNNKEWRIVSVVSANSAIVETLSGGLATLTADAPTNKTFKVKHRFVILPEDLVQVLSFGVRSPENERQEFGYLNKWLDEHLSLDIDLVSRPTDYIMVEDLILPTPVSTPAVADGGGAAGVPIEGRYDVCYTFIKYGVNSAPSPVSAQVLLAVGDELDVTNIQNTTGTGMVKRLFFSVDSASNKFVQASAADLAVGATTSAPVTFQNSATFVVSSERLPENEGRYRQLRPYPRQDTDYEATLRYTYRPSRLLDNSDTPIIPAEYHKYLVYMTCQELFVKHDNLNQSELYRVRADEILFQMERRYLTESATTWIKNVWRQSAIYRRPRPKLTHN